jgi:hypothetical protein
LAGACGLHTEEMAVIMLMLATGGFFVAGFVGWYALWHRR